jgi:adenosylmethionine-8-amino-7-oxononanoate aminotransferase
MPLKSLLKLPAPKWLEEGLQHIWLPYAQMQNGFAPLPVISTEGTRITLSNGETLIDGIASWWSACHGYNHPHILSAMQQQLGQMPHVMFAGLAHEPAFKLATRLSKLTGLPKVFFSDSGSTAVEVAMKMAVQYWANQHRKTKTRFVSFHNAYHGDTMGAMSVSDPENGMHHVYAPYMPMQYVVDLPADEYSFAEFEAVLKDNKKTIAGLIMEPLVQGAGGMRFHSPDIVAEIYRLCKEHEILFIADEVATGFGRTGSMFAYQQSGISPDLLCVGKALTGGTMTLAATLASEEIFNAFLGEELTKALMHGPTYMANPLACAAANASLDLFEKEPRLKQIEAIEAQMWAGLKSLVDLPQVEDVRVMGAIGVVELKNATWEQMFLLRQKFAEAGCWLRPFGNIIYLTPAFTIAKEDLETLLAVISNEVRNLKH